MVQELTTPHSIISKSRLEFLFDGIFAIAMTILVLDLKVPDLVDRHSIAELARALSHSGLTFVSYLLSFGMLGLFWYRHNQQYKHFKAITRSMLGLHFIQLAAAAFFPFCAALLGRYPTNGFSLVVYTGCVLSYIWATFANWVVARRRHVLDDNLLEKDYVLVRKRLFRGCLRASVIFAITLANAFFN